MYIKKDTLIPPFIPRFLMEVKFSVNEMAKNQKGCTF